MKHPYTRGHRRHQFFRWRDRVRRYIIDTWSIGSDPMESMQQFFLGYFPSGLHALPSFVCAFLHSTTEDEIAAQVRWHEKNRAACDCHICKIAKMRRGDNWQTLRAKARADSSLEDLLIRLP